MRKGKQEAVFGRVRIGESGSYMRKGMVQKWFRNGFMHSTIRHNQSNCLVRLYMINLIGVPLSALCAIESFQNRRFLVTYKRAHFYEKKDRVEDMLGRARTRKPTPMKGEAKYSSNATCFNREKCTNNKQGGARKERDSEKLIETALLVP